MNICIVGSGHVGLVTGACLAELGNKLVCMDDDVKKIESLNRGSIPFYEPELDALVNRNMQKDLLSFTTDMEEGVRKSEIIFICVGTPQKPTGEADSLYVELASKRIAKAMNGYKIIVEKSTVPVKTGSWVKSTIKLNNRNNYSFDVVSNPEFLREGKAVYDFLHPDRIVLGVETEMAAKIMVELYKPIKAPIIVTNLETAELIKHASNAFLALKISYINAIANICEKVGADVTKVAEGMGHDKRIRREFLDAGIGYGGYCLPKDVAAFIRMAADVGCDFEILKAVQKINENQRHQIVNKAKNILWNLNGKIIGVLGLSYKADTDDMREAPSVDIIRQLQEAGAKIKAYDPKAMNNAKEVLHDVEFCPDPYQVAKGADLLVLVTEWDEFKGLDLLKIKELLTTPAIIDGRNMFDPAKLKELGFIYQGVGR
jgi:UDPglucose 6-dehydrogenase